VEALAEYRFNGALDAVAKLVARMNKYIEENAPWRMAKLGETTQLAGVLYTCLDVVRVVSILLSPMMPRAASALRGQIGLDTESVPTWEEATTWGLLPPDTQAAAPQPLFPRIDLAQDAGSGEVLARQVKEKKLSETVEPSTNSGEVRLTTADSALSAGPEAPGADLITIDDFMKVQLRVANIEAAEPVPNADKLLKLTVNLGEETRTILAGIAEMYQPDELAGRQIVVVANLQPRKMRGIESQGMLLAADVDGQAIILQPETQVPAGSRVR
jgi:methionyl-tRNA synthetase